jgi:hypothetical protein
MSRPTTQPEAAASEMTGGPARSRAEASWGVICGRGPTRARCGEPDLKLAMQKGSDDGVDQPGASLLWEQIKIITICAHCMQRNAHHHLCIWRRSSPCHILHTHMLTCSPTHRSWAQTRNVDGRRWGYDLYPRRGSTPVVFSESYLEKPSHAVTIALSSTTIIEPVRTVPKKTVFRIFAVRN